MNSAGRVLIIFLLIISILLLSTTALFIFFFQKEIEKRKSVEVNLSESMERITDLEEELSKLKKQNTLLENKNKEADDRINSLLDELDLQEGLRDELKSEILSLKKEMDKQGKVKEQLDEKLASTVKGFEKKIISLESNLKSAVQEKESCAQQVKQLQEENNQLQNKIDELKKKLKEANTRVARISKQISASSTDMANLKKDIKEANRQSKAIDIGVRGLKKQSGPENGEEKNVKHIRDGRIINVDRVAEFVVIDLGKKDGIKEGTVLAVYRDNNYLGDIKVTRLQLEMAAADLVPPFSIRKIRKNDKVVVKR